MKLNKRIIAFMLATVLLVTSFAGCKARDEKSPESSKPKSVAVVESADEKIKDITPDFVEAVEEKHELNEDTVGWLQVPYTTISDVVVQYKGDRNQFYHRRNFEKENEFNGVYYSDYRCDYGDGSREDLPVNNVIYGHALTDDPEAEKYDLKFGNLHDFRNINAARENHYIFFSTGKENFVYEIVAVFLANADNPDNPYNKGDAEKGEFHKMVREEILPRSYYDYGVEIDDDDKFITLSTCIYILEDGTNTNYPNTHYRYAILGRLVDPDDPVVEELDLEYKEDRIIDKDEPMGSKKS